MSSHLVERVSSTERFRALEPAWRHLEERVAPTTPFVTFDWAAAWWQHLSESRLGVRDRLDIRVLRSERGDVVGIAPLITTCRPGLEPLAVRQLHYLGADPNITEVRGALVHPSDVRSAYTALFRELRESAGSWDFVTLCFASADAEKLEPPLGAHLPHVVGFREIPFFHVNLAPTWSEYKTRLGRNIKESIRHCFNAPKRDGLSLQFEVVSDAAEVARALDDFFHLHEARAVHNSAVRHRNVFEAPSSKRFLVDVCERFARRGAFRLFRLRIDGKVVALRIGFVLGESLYLYYSGYDPSLGRYSVMTTVVAEAIRYAIEQGFRTVSLSTGRDESKLRWSPVETLHREITVVSPSFRGWLGYQANAHARSWLARRAAPGAMANENVFARTLAGALGRRTV